MPPFYTPGFEDHARIVYNPREVDPATGNVPILGLQHLINGQWSDPAGEPASDQSVFNVRTGAIDFQRAVVHGTPIVIVFTPLHYQAIYSQTDGHMIIGGPYQMDPAGPQPCNARTWYSEAGTC